MPATIRRHFCPDSQLVSAEEIPERGIDHDQAGKNKRNRQL
jgi:hypothetical protein